MNLYTTAPLLVTDRLILDSHTIDDFDAIAALWADPQVVRYIGGTPRDREDSWGRLLRYIGHWQLLGYGCWAVREKVSGAFIGSIGFINFQRDITPPLDAPEMGWTLASAAQGKGYATEALQAALGWAQAHLPTDKLLCIISPENRASLKLAARVGFSESHRTEYHQKPIVVMQRPR
ncbi:GNAT family N-acetyltransferase [Serratia sp. AKBS12]|uniref:GNAT family N-acetyltransferase n=1 Tax=Serratia sp. AKBS12 TaxID=2974597 RepID=UPI00216642FE|nr:GNAT family N-acetyltransferase [Serratia sp. AKBS12]MCS3409454.1 GNAT family N-acetyltransferase [Serratia sp. AKBS12]HEI8865768.1 GNAT family N-acetyltransferase [Serratia odorifera]